MRSTVRAGLWILCLLALIACGGGSSGTPAGNGTNDGADPGSTPGGGDLDVFVSVVTPGGRRLGNMAVFVDGAGPYITGGLGTAEVSGVAAPYDVVILDGAGGYAHVFEGVTRTDPVFEISKTLRQNSFLLEGNVRGGVLNPSPNTKTWVLFNVTEDGTRRIVEANSISGFFASNGSLAWEGDAHTEVVLVAHQYEADANGLPISWNGFGRTRIQVQDGDLVGSVEVQMNPVVTAALSGFTLPKSGLSVDGRFAQVRLEDGIAVLMPYDSSGTPSFSLNVPIVANATHEIFAWEVSSGWVTMNSSFTGLSAPASGLSLTLEHATDHVLPFDGAVGVDHDTLFVVGSAGVDRVHEITFQPASGWTGPTIVLRTAESAFQIPDLTAFGIGLPSGAEYVWRANAWSPAGSIDDTLVRGFASNQHEGATDRHYSQPTYTWSFTLE